MLFSHPLAGAHLGLGVLQGGARFDWARVGREDGGMAPLQVAHRFGEQRQPDQVVGPENGQQPQHPLRPQEHRHEGKVEGGGEEERAEEAEEVGKGMLFFICFSVLER